MPEFPYVLVDVFTDQPLTGNALAVFTDARGLSVDVMQALARELNLSESTFVLPPERGGTARVRIFTPRSEVPFAGHPTLGTGIVLGNSLGVDEVTLELSVGQVPVVLTREGSCIKSGWFTRRAPEPVPFNQGELLQSALGVAQTASPLVVYDNGMRHAVVHLKTAAEVEALRPNMNALAALPVDTVDVFSWEGRAAMLRVFAPVHGVVEDPATGSAAAPVLCHLIANGGFDPRATLEIRQGAGMRRPSLLHVRISTATTGESLMVDVGGAGVEVAAGVFRLPHGSKQSRHPDSSKQ